MFITKEISKQWDTDFLIDNVYKYNLDKEKVELINLSDSLEASSERTSINYIKDNFYTPNCRKEDRDLIEDGHIHFETPFHNKSEELEYISKK